jgi:hypothetical protein
MLEDYTVLSLDGLADHNQNIDPEKLKDKMAEI